MRVIRWHEFQGTNEVGETPYRAAAYRTIRATMTHDGIEYGLETVVHEPTEQRLKDVRERLTEMLLGVP